MSGIESRAPNMVGAALLDEQSWCGIILDGHQVDPNTAKFAYKAKASRKIILVTDSMSTIASEQTHRHFDGHNIQLLGDKLLSDSGQLAGSALNMMAVVNNAKDYFVIPLIEALNMASLYPAEFLGIAKTRGQLSIGADADFTLVSTTNSSPHILNTWIGGNSIL
tara:strand:+ start:13498 stop:13992 length:495 start_codon:yes stop_codon:yes gene_type:complete